jgi:DNA-binding NtrC family response regulator
MAVILIVEDEPTVLMLVESILQSAGYETLSAGTLSEAQVLAQSKVSIDLIFTDLGLGDQSEAGFRIGELASRIRPGLPVLYSTGRPLTDGMKELFVDPSAFLEKPFTNDQLVEAVAEGS